MKRVRIGLYGTNGHQIQDVLPQYPEAELIAIAGFPAASCAAPGRYETLDQLLADGRLDLVSLCSPRRHDQAADAIKCLKAGKHVYAEKPCALTERDLNEIIAMAKQSNRPFHEMAGTVVQQPYREMRRLIREGAIGEVVQVLAQKSYPWAAWRPAHEAIDGGLALQAGVYVTRFVEHVACQKIVALEIAETKLGNPSPACECGMAVSLQMRLANGGVACGVFNYLNPIGKTCRGYDMLRIFGTKGMLESDASNQRPGLLLDGQPPRLIDLPQPSVDYFLLFLRAVLHGEAMPLSLDEELSPTRWVVRAKNGLPPKPNWFE
ncbi:MAG TPA: Gfo/Idh/MocA family oxidoreductase [Verrucomicrobiae bacterium]|nr:Gfo/Idh/MocA family oxidoreductase [Verrucomicrobiae bacterium]